MKLDVNSSLTSFTLLVDEIMFVFKQINDVNPGFTMIHFENALLILKSAMLDVSYRGAGNKAVNIALVISSLDIKPLGVTSSGRPIAPLDIDSFLNPEEIVSSWWLPSLGVVDFSGTDKFRLGLIASTIGNMPRIVESVLPLLKDIVEISGNRRDVIDAAAVQLIFKSVLSELISRYPDSRIDANDFANYSLVFGEKVFVDEKTMQLVSGSIFTNCLTSFGDKAKILPEACVAMLALSSTSEALMDPLYCYKLLYESVVESIASYSDKGECLERMLTCIMQCRLAAAHGAKRNTLLLSDLLAISYRDFKSLEFILPTNNLYKQKSELPVIKNGAKKYAAKFNEHVFNSSNEFEMHVSLPFQNYDLMMVLKLTNGTLFIVFMDATSADINTVESKGTKTKSVDLKQYNYVKKAVEALRNMASKGKALSAASQALVDGKYAFIYVTTYANLSNIQHEKVYFMIEDEAKALLGVTWEFYECFRASI